MNTVLITPSWLITKKADHEAGLKTLRSLGLTVLNPALPKRLPTPAGKAAQLHAAFLRKDARLVLAQRGGYSSLQMLPYVDFGIIRRHPKLLAGFSDISTLLNTIHERAGLVTLHSPMLLNLDKPTPFTERSFMNALAGFPDKQLLRDAPVTVYRPGRAVGTLKGGNLVTISSMIGTPWDTKTDGAIVFLEDVDEKPHEVDRYLTHWILAGKFNKVKALILGDFRGVDNRAAWRVISSQMKVTFPVIHCPFIGHVKDKATLPVGARVRLDTSRKQLEVL